MMHFKSRFLAGTLAFIVAVSSLQIPAGSVKAEEAKEAETGTEESGSGEGDVFESATGIVESVAGDTETVTESIGTVEMTEEVETVAESTETVETVIESTETEEAVVESTEIVETAEETETTETELESEEQEEILGTEEVTLESEAETEQILRLSESDIASGISKNITWVIDANGKLTAEGTGDFEVYSYYQYIPWSPYTDRIRSAEIKITGMTNASQMFDRCWNLTSIDMSGFDTSNVADMTVMFRGCKSLGSLDVSGFDTSKVTDMNGMFSGCSSLKSLDVSGFDTSNVIIMSEMFKGCSELTDVDISGFNTSKVTNMNEMFNGCSSLTDVDIVSGFNTSKVTNMKGMFKGCSSLTDVNVSGFDTSKVINMSEMFSGCWKLTSLDLSGFDTSKVINMREMFRGCSRLNDRDIVSDFKTSNVRYMDGMFKGCSSLVNLNVNSFNTSNVTTMEYMFSECRKLTSLDLSSFDTSNIIDDIEGVNYGMVGMFSGCWKLTSLDLSSFNTSNVIRMDELFSGCSSLKSLDVSGFDTSNVIIMSEMFKGCSELTDVDISGFNTSKVISMGGMFNGCSSLTDVDIVSGFNTSKVISMGGMFNGCSSLTDVNVSGFDTSKVINMSEMFNGCSSLTSVGVVNAFNTSNVINMKGMFKGCSSLPNIDINDFDTSNVTDMSEMFSGCSNLKSIDISNFDVRSITNMEALIDDCTQLAILYTPCNLQVSANLYGDWYKTDGTKINTLPQGLAYSIIITKNQVPAMENVGIRATKKKVVYQCGEILHTDDLTVKCCDTEGIVRRVTDYTTNANQIDMSTSGVKQLVITYRGYTTEVPITVKGSEVPIKILGLTISDSIYNGEPFAYTGTASVTTDTGVDVTDDVSLTYTYSGTMTDGSSYETSMAAPVNAGNYTLTVAVDKNDRKYSGSAEFAFKITKASIEIIASNIARTIGSSLPAAYEYQTDGLLNGDVLITEPLFTCNVDMERAGDYEIIPHDADAGMNYDITYTKGIFTVEDRELEKEKVTISGISIPDGTYTGKAVSYVGKASVKLQDETDVTDSIPLTFIYSGEQADGNEYMPTGTAPANAGSYTLTVAVPQDNEHYAGSMEYHFEIAKAAIIVSALDKTFQIGTDTALPDVHPYEVTGLLNNDELAREPAFMYTDMDGKEITKDDIDLKKAGHYEVLPKDADAGMNYTINYQKGILIIKETEEPLPDDDGDNEVLPGDIPEAGIPENNTIWASAVADQSYTGAAVKPAVRVYFGKKRLTEKTDYTITYKNNKQLGEADIIITGKGNYRDRRTLHFNIIPKDISDKDIVIEDMAYADNGKQHKTAPNVVYNGKKLKAGRDFDITYGEGDYTTAGEYYAVITGKGNFTGTCDKVKTTIIGKDKLLNKAKITKIPNQEYNRGQEIVLPDSAVKVTLNGIMLVKDTDYTVDYVNNQNVGKATVVIRGKGNYAGTKTASFKIVRTPVNIKDADLICDFNREAVFSKGGCMPVPKVSYGGENLRNGTDYTVSYKNNKKFGTASFTVKGKGNFKGSRTFEFLIKQKELSAVAIRTVDVAWVNKANKYQSKPVLTDADGNVLKAGTDYRVIKYEHDGKILGRQDCPTENAIISVTVEGKGNYWGTCTASYQLKAGTSLKKAKITIADQTYTGASIKPGGNAITGASVKKKGTTENLVYGRDYEIAAYGSNVKKGSGTVVLRGLGDYYGETTIKFKIVGKSVK